MWPKFPGMGAVAPPCTHRVFDLHSPDTQVMDTRYPMAVAATTGDISPTTGDISPATRHLQQVWHQVSPRQVPGAGAEQGFPGDPGPAW